MKICFLAAANSIHSVRWIKYFAEKNEIIWISFAEPILEAKDLISSEKRISFFYMPFKKNVCLPFSVIFCFMKTRRIIKKENPQILHSHSAGIYGLVSSLLIFHPFILTAWGSDVLIFPNNYLRKKITRFILNRVDLITTDGYNAQEVMMKKLGVEKDKIRFIQFGVDIKKFFSEKNSQKINDLISLRSLEPVYNIETLIKAVNIVKKKINGIKCIIAGSGSEEEKLKKLVKELILEKNINFLGKIEYYNLPRILNNSKIYISTSLSDSGLSMSTAEAMASGLPVVISDFGDNKKWVKDSENGFVVSVKNPEELAEKIVHLLENSNLARQMGENNQKLIEEKNNYYKEMEKMEKLYEKFVGKV